MGIDLEKKAAKVVLEKRNLTTPPTAEVALMIDISGSMSDEYARGEVQAVVNRCLAVASMFDRDGKMDVWTFDNNSSYIGEATESEVPGFVDRRIVNNPNIHKWGGTSYAPVLEDVRTHFFGGGQEVIVTTKQVEKQSGGLFGMFGKKTVETVTTNEVVNAPSRDPGVPVFALFITDGENDDRHAFEKVLQEMRDKNFYLQIVGIGNSNLSYVEKVANAELNCGFCQIKNLNIGHEAMIEQLIQPEFVNWVKKF